VKVEVKPDAAQLRSLLQTFNDIPKDEKTAVRSALRHTGDDVISGQRAVLDGPLPPGVQVTGKTTTLAFNKKTRHTYVRTVNVFGDVATKRGGRSSGLREGIKAGLVTRVVTGTTRQSIEIKTQTNKAPMSTGWNAKRFRHPVFGNKDTFVYQAGQPYFFDPIFKGRAAMIEDAVAILNKAVEGR
jgi:hypothetical protein